MTSWIVSEDIIAQGVVVRDASRADIPRVVALYRTDELTRKHGAESAADVEPGYYDTFERIEADPQNRLLVAEAGAVVVGAFQLTFVPDMRPDGREVAIVENVIVDSAARGLGVGSAMMRWAIDESRRRGCSQVKLTSNNARENAHRFYRRLGFEDTHAGFKFLL